MSNAILGDPRKLSTLDKYPVKIQKRFQNQLELSLLQYVL